MKVGLWRTCWRHRPRITSPVEKLKQSKYNHSYTLPTSFPRALVLCNAKDDTGEVADVSPVIYQDRRIHMAVDEPGSLAFEVRDPLS